MAPKPKKRIKPVSDKRRQRVTLRYGSTIAVSATPTQSRPATKSAKTQKQPPQKRKVSKPIARTAIKKHARKPSETRRIYGPPARRAWIKSLPSVLSGEGPCENVHVRGDGVSRKADACWIVPLTAAEHRELHDIGIISFEALHWIDLIALAQNTEAEWQREAARRGIDP